MNLISIVSCSADNDCYTLVKMSLIYFYSIVYLLIWFVSLHSLSFLGEIYCSCHN